MKLLFYIEPVVFRNNPDLLGYWVDQCAAIAAQSAHAMTTSIVLNGAMTGRHPDSFSQTFPLSSFDLTVAFGFDRAQYAQDLVGGSGFPNIALVASLEDIRDRLAPDVVISWSENRYLRHVFKDSRVLFMELGPLPRSGLKLAAYLDPFGHQADSAIASLPAFDGNNEIERRLLDRWDGVWKAKVTRDADSSGATEWINSVRSGFEVVLLALQPNDWITYEGLRQRLDPVSLIAQTSRRYGTGFRVLPTWHPAGPPPSEEMLDFLGMECRNVIVPPPALRIATSEVFLPFVDAVATVSSNVAVAGAIESKLLDIFNPGKFSSLASGRRHRRGDLLAFLICRFCRPLEEWTGSHGAFARHLDQLLHEPDRLFSPVKENELERLDDFTAAGASG